MAEGRKGSGSGRGGKGSSGLRSGRAGLKTKVKTARKRSVQSTRWLQRQLNDPYVEEARRQGFRSRAAFKLIEIDDREGILSSGARVLDLGAAPGGWTQVAVERVGPQGKVVAVDLLDMEPVPGAQVLKLDFLDPDAPEKIEHALGGPVDVVLSDMAAPTTGHRQTDHLRTMALFEAGYDFALAVLKPGGAFLSKVFRGGTESQLLQQMRQRFDKVKHIKPPASRKESVELYVLASGFRNDQSEP
ncbi:MAG: RlmE family RNA methyltransferase [Pseudomonadota bacterium]